MHKNTIKYTMYFFSWWSWWRH